MFRLASTLTNNLQILSRRSSKHSDDLRRVLLLRSASRRCRSLTSFFGPNAKEPEIHDPGVYEIILPPEPPVWGVKHIPIRDAPKDLPRPPYAVQGVTVEEEDRYHGDPYDGDGRVKLGTDDERRLRQACALAKRTLSKASELIRVGTSTHEIDAALHDFIVSNNAYPSPLKYAGFPKSCCTSVNNIVVHGIPDDRKLMDGDIINVDITVYIDGFHGDTSQTFLVGNVDELGRNLVRAASEAVHIGVRECRPGAPFKNIGKAIHAFAKSRNLSVSEQFTGHGIGKVFHRPPWILHHRNDEPGVMLPGHCFTIELDQVQGPGFSRMDGPLQRWKDGSRSAQAEHTVLITETGVDILTQ